ncbi:SRPBCC family protein [Desertivirga brevis]|uniref:SRPBCC family protein n=1 Tax=Desertivirga brevis TaxID=2810310 RepID=UPI001A971B5A|nr:SRPBCC family protein [Pedobacter sp. SYSU D00873]
MKKLLYVSLAAIGLLAITIVGLEIFSSYTVSESINPDAPVKTYQQITINASPQKVYKIMSEIDHWDEWHNDVQEPILTGPFAKGSSFDWKSGGLTIHSTLHTAIPAQKIGWSGKALGAFAIHNWQFLQDGDNTVVRVEESMEGWLVTLMQAKFQNGLEQSLQTWLNNLKAEAEKQ